MRRRAAECLLVAVAATVLVVARAPASGATAVELARTLQHKYDSIRDFSADFVHSYQGGVLRKQITERGHVLIKKPGKMRWEYIAPEKKLFVSDGVRMYSYVPEDKQVIVSAVPGGDSAAAPALFLAGKGDLTRDFTASLGEAPSGARPGASALKLVPKVPQPDYESLVVLFDQASFAIEGLVTTDAQGGRSAISFENLKENVGTADKAFTFSIPRGVDVITDAAQ